MAKNLTTTCVQHPDPTRESMILTPRQILPRLVRSALVASTLAAFPTSTALAHQTWELRSGVLSGSSTPTRAVYSGGRFLVFSAGATTTSTYWHSAAGTAAWSFASLPSPPSNYNVQGAAAGNGRVVISGPSNTIYTTTTASVAGLPDTAIDWTKRNPVSRSSLNPDLYGVRFLNGRFIMGTAPYTEPNLPLQYSEILTSTDGETWTSHKIMATALGNTTFQPRDFAFMPGATAGTGTWVVTANNTGRIYLLPENLSSATAVTLTSIGSSQRVAFAAGKFVMVTANGAIHTSTNGTSWTQRSTLPVATASLNDVFHDGERFVAVGATVTGSNPQNPAILHSTDGETWTQATTVPGTTFAMTSVIRADGLWLATGASRTVITSGTASVGLPVISGGPFPQDANAGQTVTLSATVTGNPASTYQWLRNGTAVTDGTTASGSAISGATTASITITGISVTDAGEYMLRATNNVGVTNSTAVRLSVSVASNGAILTPYGTSNTLGGTLVPGASPVQAVGVAGSPATFTIGSGIDYLPNTFVNPSTYNQTGGTNPAGTKVLLGTSSGAYPLMVYDLATRSGTLLPPAPLPLGPVTAVNLYMPISLAENGDVTGIIQDSMGQNRAFHFSAATSTYTLLGNVPNATNDIASNPGGISADGRSISGYERTSFFDGPFVWTTTGGFTLLPSPAGGAANGDVRGISPNGRWITGYGNASVLAGSGQGAIRWDRGSPVAGSPKALGLQKRAGDTFADGRTVNDDGTVGGNVRAGWSFADNRAAVWLPDGALVVIPEYLQSKYGLTTPGFTLSQVTSISDDLRTVAGTANNSAGMNEGWILRLPEPISVTQVPDIVVRANTGFLSSGMPVNLGTQAVGGGPGQQTLQVRSDGSGALSTISLSIGGTNAGDFTYALDAGTTSFPTSMLVGEQAAIHVRFSPLPGAAGARSATLTITSNDPDENPFVINLNGTATIPVPTAAETALHDYLASSGVPEGKRGPLDDPDHDGVVNLMEFALGQPPMEPSAPLESSTAGGNLSLTYTRARPDHVNYLVVFSSTLASWSEVGVDQGTPDGAGVTTATIPMGSGPGFLRLRVSLKP